MNIRNTLTTSPRMFSTENRPKEDEPEVVEAEVISETTSEEHKDAEGEEQPEGLHFDIEDALLVRYTIIEQLRTDRVARLLKAVASSPDDIMNRWNAIKGVVSSVTYQVIESLTEDGKVNLPPLGESHHITSNFNTIYDVVSLSEEGARLRIAMDEQWVTILELGFDVDPALTRNAKISTEAAKKIAYMYLEFTKTKEFDDMVRDAMENVACATDAHISNATAQQIETRQRQRKLTEIVCQFLTRVYSTYQYDGDDGFLLMQKAMDAHFVDPEVVEPMLQASKIATTKAGVPDE